MSKEYSARRLDVQSFAEEGARLEGGGTVGQHERLLAETDGRGGETPLRWVAEGALRNPGHVEPEVWLHLQAHATLPLTCQRCLNPVEVPVEIDRDFRFVADEATAAAEDDEAEEDLLALSKAFDVVELVEDEILMALPVAPMHDVCPEPVRMSAGDVVPDAPRENPFAVLQKLRQGGS